MPPAFTDEGLVAALEIRRTLPSTAVLVLSQFVQRRYAMELVRQRGGGVGYLLKQRISDIETFRADLKRICSGGTVLDPEVVARFMDPPTPAGPDWTASPLGSATCSASWRRGAATPRSRGSW